VVRCDNGGHFEEREHRAELIHNTGGTSGWVAIALSSGNHFKRGNELCLDQFPVSAVRAWWRAIHAQAIFDEPLRAREAREVVVLADYFGIDWLRDKCDGIIAEALADDWTQCRHMITSFSCLFGKDSGAAAIQFFLDALDVWRVSDDCSLSASKHTAFHGICDFFNVMTRAPPVDGVRSLMTLFVEAEARYGRMEREEAIGLSINPRTTRVLTDEETRTLQQILDLHSGDVWEALRCYNGGVDVGHDLSAYGSSVQLAMWDMMSLLEVDSVCYPAVDRLRFVFNTFLPVGYTCLVNDGSGDTLVPIDPESVESVLLFHAGMEIAAMRRSVGLLAELLPGVVDEALPIAVRCRALRFAYLRLSQRTKALSERGGYIELNSYKVTGMPPIHFPVFIGSESPESDRDSDGAIDEVNDDADTARPAVRRGLGLDASAPLGSAENPIVLFDDGSSNGSENSVISGAEDDRILRNIARLVQGLDVILESFVEANNELKLIWQDDARRRLLFGNDHELGRYERLVNALDGGGRKLREGVTKLKRFFDSHGIRTDQL
jgi:hypothetical protein